MKTIEKNSRENNKQDLLDKLENTKTMRDNLIVRKDNLIKSIKQLTEQIELLENRLKTSGKASNSNGIVEND